MTNFIIRRTIENFIMLFFISMLIYMVLNLVPGGPFDMMKMSNPRMTQSMVDRLNRLLDLDKPILPGKYCPVDEAGDPLPCTFDQGRYFRWLGRVLKGDWGASWTMQTGTPVMKMIGQRLGYTFLLMGLSLIVALLFAIPIGVYSAVRQYSFLDYLFTTIAFFGQSMPTFWTGLMVMSIFAVTLSLFPTGGVRTTGMEGDIIEAFGRIFSFGAKYPELAGVEGATILDGLWHVALPVFVLAFFNMAAWTRYMRASMLEVLRQDYMRTARAKGLVERMVILKHGFRNSLIPLITLFCLTIPALFGGAIITESIFSWPGMGRMFIDAVANVDWPVVQGLLVISAGLTVFSNLLADILYAVVDPRIQYN